MKTTCFHRSRKIDLAVRIRCGRAALLAFLVYASGCDDPNRPLGNTGATSLQLAAAATTITNGSFETGDFTGWFVQQIESNPPVPIQVAATGFDRGFGFFLSQPTDRESATVLSFERSSGGSNSGRLEQNLFVHPDATVIEFDYRAGWIINPGPGSNAQRRFLVRVRNPGVNNQGGGVRATFPVIIVQGAQTVLDTGDQAGSVDLSAFAGQTINLSFEWESDETNQGPGFFQLDNVRARSTVAPVDTALVVTSDAYLKKGQPNQNQGSMDHLRIRQSGSNRALVLVDQDTLLDAIAGGTVLNATLLLTISDNGNNWGSEGRLIAAHRMDQAWTELGATWNCAIDLDTANHGPDCPGGEWEMGKPNDPLVHPWVSTPTATALIRNEQAGEVSFDVTQDVQAFAGDTEVNAGWLIRKVEEGLSGRIDFWSREGAIPGLLVITVQR